MLREVVGGPGVLGSRVAVVRELRAAVREREQRFAAAVVLVVRVLLGPGGAAAAALGPKAASSLEVMRPDERASFGEREREREMSWFSRSHKFGRERERDAELSQRRRVGLVDVDSREAVAEEDQRRGQFAAVRERVVARVDEHVRGGVVAGSRELDGLDAFVVELEPAAVVQSPRRAWKRRLIRISAPRELGSLTARFGL